MSLQLGGGIVLLSVKEVMGRTGLPRSTVYKYVKEGIFPNAAKIARSWAIPESDLEDWRKRRPTPGRPRDDDPTPTAEYKRRSRERER